MVLPIVAATVAFAVILMAVGAVPQSADTGSAGVSGSMTVFTTGLSTNSTTSTSAGSNTTVDVQPDFANVPHHIYKNPGANMTLLAWVTDPVTVSGVVTTPDNVTLPMTETYNANGTVYLKITLGESFPSGYYTLLVSVVKGPNTSITMSSEDESFAETTGYPGLHP
jgi:hypothetical protein